MQVREKFVQFQNLPTVMLLLNMPTYRLGHPLMKIERQLFMSIIYKIFEVKSTIVLHFSMLASGLLTTTDNEH